jgi:hypothetical protein
MAMFKKILALFVIFSAIVGSVVIFEDDHEVIVVLE